MRLAPAIGLLATLAGMGLPGAVSADSRTQVAKIFACGGGEVELTFAIRKQPGLEDHVEAIVTVRRADRSTVLRYDGEVDDVGGVCVNNGRSQPTVVFQAYCGGSGCHDLDNWGIIDPRDLRVLLVPNDWNRADAARILGTGLPKIEPMITVDAKRLGLDP